MNVRAFVRNFRRSRVVRVAFIYVPTAWVALRAILIAIPGLDAPDWVPKLFGVLLLIGFPIALIISWAMDVGDEEELRKANENQILMPGGNSNTASKQMRATTFGVILVFGTAVLGGAIYTMLNPDLLTAKKPENEIDSVAVLPFLDLSAGADQRMFCDGLSEELLNLLTGIESLRVAARTSSFAMRDSDMDVPSIGKKLRVSHIVEGSVRRDGDQLRVTAQLVRSSDGYHIWSQNYDREFTKIFEIQDDIASNIVARLVKSRGNKSTLDDLPTVDRTNPEAYFAYLKGRGALTSAGKDNLWLAAQQFDEALELSPTYEPAIIGKLYTETLLGLSEGQALDERRLLFTTALSLFESEPDDVWGATAASVLGLSLYEWERTQDVLELGLGANLNDVSLSALNLELLLTMNDIEGAELEVERTAQIAPGVAALHYLGALMKYDSSLEALENLYVVYEDARNWNHGSMQQSTSDARRKLFRDCSADYAAADDLAMDVGACDALRSFYVPLLALQGEELAALEKINSMVETRTFDGVLVHMPEVAALLQRPEATTAREILNLPTSGTDLSLAQLTE